jgi:TonB-dependent receptor
MRNVEFFGDYSNSRSAKLFLGASVIALTLGADPAFAQAAAPADAQPATQTPAPQDEASSNKDVIVVTGIRASLRSARNIKKNSEQIVDSITASDIGSLPDRSVSEALQRIPGITLQRTNDNRDPARLSAEGGGVFIRGLSWIRSELNGRDVFSARNGRSLSFEDVSSDLLGGIDVYKNPSADLVEGGIGGLVNLRTRKPFDQKGQLLAASIDYNYADMRKKGFKSGNVLYSNNWDMGNGGRLGLLLSVSLNNIGNRTDSIQTGPWAQRTPDATNEVTAFTPNSPGVRRIDWEQKRQTFAGSLQWQPVSEFTLTFEGMYAKATPTDTENLIGDYNAPIPALASNTYDDGVFVSGTVPGRQVTLDTRVSHRKYITQDYSLNARWTPGDHWTFSVDGQRVLSKANINDFTVFTATKVPVTGTYNLSGSNPSISYAAENGGDLSDPANYWWLAAMDHYERNDATEWATRADAEYKFLDSPFLQSFRFGVRHTDKEAISRQTGYNWALLSSLYGMDWCGCAIPVNGSQFAGAAELFPYKNFARGDSNSSIPAMWFPSASMVGSGPQAAYNQYLQYARSMGWSWVPYGPDAYLQQNPRNDNVSGGLNDQTEKTLAAYGLLRFKNDAGLRFDGNIGLRVVETRNDASGSGLQVGTISGTTTVASCQAAAASHKDAQGNPAPYPASICDPLAAALSFTSATVNNNPVSPKNKYTDWLPSLNIRFFLKDNLFLRLAASRAIYRPQFYQLNTFASLGFNFDANGFPKGYGTPQQEPTFTGTAASPDLKSQKANQLDASLEYYFGNAGQLSAAVFYKRIKGYIVALPTTETFTNAAGQSLDFVLTRYVNADKGTVAGGELAYQQFFDFLPRPLDGVGLQANLTYIHNSGGANSPVNIFDPNQVTNSFANLPMEGMSKWSYNVALMYEKYGVSARLAYNWRSHYLLTTSAANDNLPVWSEAYGQLDGSIFYNLTKYLKIGVQGTNLLNSKTILNEGFASFHPRSQWTVTDRRYALIARVQFQ